MGGETMKKIIPCDAIFEDRRNTDDMTIQLFNNGHFKAVCFTISQEENKSSMVMKRKKLVTLYRFIGSILRKKGVL
jgi:hypothetical protein